MMKQRIFSRGKGWYIPCVNYKDKEDKSYLYVNFKKEEEPSFNPPVGQEWMFVDIDILECKFGCKDGKTNMMVWKYTVIPSAPVKEDTRMFGRPNTIDPDELPFY